MRYRRRTNEQISASPSEDAMWRAIQTRDRSADGQFVYGVRSTGVYCRPSCPSRKPSRDHVSFFLLPQAAEERGFRPCLRCRPRAARIRDPRLESVAQVCRKIESQVSADAEGEHSGLTLSVLAGASGMAAHQLERAFRRIIGITPRQYADAQRMLHLKARLKKGDNVTTALYEAGFGSSSRLYERAPSQLGMTPATYRQGGAGMRMHYTIADSPLGRLLVAATDRGISALYLGESDARL
jgi:AraC family transcriptional regulator of adaptative response/methylated-DNA-[protein]-cysteine methyltransferase